MEDDGRGGADHVPMADKQSASKREAHRRDLDGSRSEAGTTVDLWVRELAGRCRVARDDEVLEAARRLLGAKVRGGLPMSSPRVVMDFLRLQMGTLDHEEFLVLFLDTRDRLISHKTMFRGTSTQTSVYPREVAREALAVNAGAVILAHNHPAGPAEPSAADGRLTQVLKAALSLVDVQVRDHVIVAGDATVSMAELGML
jgi:DNA repair protein RadC